MAEQEHKRAHTTPSESDETAIGGAERNEELDEAVDSILDEIDSLLEENAEDFVKSFVQKGGQ